MKWFIGLCALIFSSFLLATSLEFPSHPDSELTPGSLCQDPGQFRYPERIPYCIRKVNGNVKKQIFEDYRKMGFKMNLKDRSDYKIDHFIPLCAGGSNNPDNLWPQHVSIFTITDPLEAVGCVKLSEGIISQAHLVDLIREGKLNLDRVPAIIEGLEQL